MDDRTLIKLNGKDIDYVDNIAKALYYLSNEELNKMKDSNINSTKYSLDSDRLLFPATFGTFTASNK